MQAVDNCLVTAVILLLARLANASANRSSDLLHALLQNRLAHAGPNRLRLPSSDYPRLEWDVFFEAGGLLQGNVSALVSHGYAV